MPDFAPEWLAVREPFDAAARSGRLTRRICERLEGKPIVRVVDLATGTGANLRYLQPRLPRAQRWTVIDNDPAMLAALGSRLRDWPSGVDVSILPLDLARGADLAFDRADLVTASALLDLASTQWLESIVRACTAAHAAALFVLNYDGRVELGPHDPDDERLRDLVNRHQRTDKGFGPAAGPDAVAATAAAFQRAGYEVDRERSDWQIGTGDTDLQTQLIRGWAKAAMETAPAAQGSIHAWQQRRLAHVEAGRSSMIVGHEDLAAWPVERFR